jgi:hypothetical protein
VNASAFGTGSVLEYTLTVSDVSDGRTASTTAEVTVIEPVEASVTVSSSSGSLELGVLRVNKDRKIVVAGSIVYATDVSAFWEMAEGYLDSKSFEDVASTSLNKTFSGGSAFTASTASFPLAILPDSLSEGLSYKFQLTGAVSETESVFASLTVAVNNPPSSGSLVVSPSQGLEYNTSFVFQAKNWDDEEGDLPLTYSFYYSASTSKSDGSALKTNTLSTSVSSKLASGSWYGILVARDSLDAYSTVHESLLVRQEANRTTAQLASALTSLASSAQSSEELLQVASLAATALLSTSTSTINCTELHRTTDVQTGGCGLCLDNFAIPSGLSKGSFRDSEQACVKVVTTPSCSNGQQDGSETDEDCGGSLCGGCAENKACSVDSDCAIGTCSSNKCKAPSKTCPSDCSGNGDCLFTNSKKQLISDCKVTNSYCWASCSCDDGWSGKGCSLSDEDYEGAVELTNLVLSSVTSSYGGVLGSDDLISSTASNVANVLTGGSVDASDLDEDTLGSVTGVLGSVASDLRDSSSFDSDVADDVANSLSAIVVGSQNKAAKSGNSSSFLQNVSSSIVDSVSSVSEAALNSLQLGEEGVSTSTSALESYSVKETSEDVLGSTFLASGSTSDSYGGSGGGFETSSDFGLEGTDSLGISLSEFFWNTREEVTDSSGSNVTVNSNILRLGLQSEKLDGAGRRRLMSVLGSRLLAESSSQSVFYLTSGEDLVSLANSYSSNSTQNSTFTVSCEAGQAGWSNFSCPSGVNVSYECTGVVNNLTIICPYSYQTMVCALYGSDGTWDTSSCSLVNTGSSVYCNCSLSSSSLSFGDDDGSDGSLGFVDVASMVASFTSGGARAIYSYLSDDDSNGDDSNGSKNIQESSNSIIIISVIVSVVAVVLFGLMMMIYKKRNDLNAGKEAGLDKWFEIGTNGTIHMTNPLFIDIERGRMNNEEKDHKMINNPMLENQSSTG